MSESPAALYWAVLSDSVDGPAASLGPRSWPGISESKLDAISQFDHVPLATVATGLGLTHAMRDALAKLVAIAVTPSVTNLMGAASPRPSMVTLSTLLGIARSRGDEHALIAQRFAPDGDLERAGLIRHARQRGELGATRKLVELVTGVPWISGHGRAVETHRDANLGILSETETSRLGLVLRAIDLLTKAPVHLCGRRGWGRTHLASALAARLGTSELLVRAARTLMSEPRAAHDFFADAFLRGAQPLVTDVDDTDESRARDWIAIAKTFGAQVWTTSVSHARWSGGASRVVIPEPSSDSRILWWDFELRQRGLSAETSALQKVSKLGLGRHAVYEASRIAKSMFSGDVSGDALIGIAQVFQGE